MQNYFLEDRIRELKKTISLLEWDIPHIKNNKLRAVKEEQLRDYKRELDELFEKTKLEHTDGGETNMPRKKKAPKQEIVEEEKEESSEETSESNEEKDNDSW